MSSQVRLVKLRCVKWSRIVVVVVGLLASQARGPLAHAAAAPLIVNIDNPNFRKLAVAVPVFHVSGASQADVQQVARDGATELARLLAFTGMFSVMSEDAYKEIAAKMHAHPGLNSAQGLEAVEVLQWKGIGVESLTIGDVTQEADGLTFNLRTVDINKSGLLLGKKYSKVAKGDVIRVMRRYADIVLQAYTGKPGIFSTMLVFVGKQSTRGDKQIYVSDFDGSNARQITRERVPHLSPSWSPDGRFITYTSYEDGNPDLFIYDITTGKKRKLSGRRGLNSGSNWSPNGRLVAFTGSVEGDADIYVTAPTGGERKLLIRGQGLDVDPAFSPDGKWLAFVSGRFGNPHIFRASLEWRGDADVRVKEDKRLTYAGWYNATPAWSPASDKIVFAGYDKDIDRFDLFMMNPDGTGMERLTIRAGDNESPTWSPNGQMVIFHSNRIKGVDKKAQCQIWVMNRDGGGQRSLTTGLFDAQTPKWGPVLGEMALSQAWQVLDHLPRQVAEVATPTRAVAGKAKALVPQRVPALKRMAPVAKSGSKVSSGPG